MDDLRALYSQVILDHAKSPRNFRKLEDANRIAQGNNPVCGDNYTVYLKMEGDIIKEIGFQGSGCEISKASASILSQAIKDKNRGDIKILFDKIRHLITTGIADEGLPEKLAVFSGVHKFPMRVKCAILPWHAVMAAMEGKDEPVSTE